jgi:RimJ/RimL family protein N-acetyltransferase
VVEPVVLQTERLRLRGWVEADRAPFAALNADPVVMEHFPAPLSRAESDAFVDRILARFAADGWGLWAAERTDDGAFIGYIGMAVPGFDADFMPCVEIGWRLAREHWGNGYAPEGAREVVRFAFEDLGLAELVSFTSVGNDRSRRVMEKIGMRLEREFDHPSLPEGHPIRPHVLYTLRR